MLQPLRAGAVLGVFGGAAPHAARLLAEGEDGTKVGPGRFRVEDDLGNPISLRVPPELVEGVEGLLARRVRAAGTARVSRDGRLLDVVVTDVAGVPESTGLEPLPFWNNADLEAALRQRPPVRSIDDLEIADPTDEEAQGFGPHQRAACLKPGSAVVETMVFSAAGVRGTNELRTRNRPHLEGCRLVLSFKTVAELRFGALNAGWRGPRRHDLGQRLAVVPVAGYDDQPTTVYVEPRHELTRAGHALGQKLHGAHEPICEIRVRTRGRGRPR